MQLTVLSFRTLTTTALAAATLTACAAPAPEGLSVRTGPGGEQMISYRPSAAEVAQAREAARTTRPLYAGKSYAVVGEGAGAVALGKMMAAGQGLPARLPAAFREEGGAVIHAATGARLPREHQGCRLAALGPLPGGYGRGGMAEYDCRPGALPYVTVVFAGGVGELAQEEARVANARVAGGIVRQETGIPSVECQLMDLSGVAGHPNRQLASAQCGARWGNRNMPAAAWGTAAVVLSRGTTYVALINTCVEPSCDANRVEYGKFLDSFDQSGLKASAG